MFPLRLDSAKPLRGPVGFLLVLFVVNLLPFGGYTDGQQLSADDHFETGGPASPMKIDFETGIMPVLSRYGCNAADCHGSATGRGDFKLSLFGGDPDRDYDAIVHHLKGRRINRSQPEKSLLLSKPLEMLAHGGGEIFERDSEPAERLRRWIEAGVPRHSGIEVTQVQVDPPVLVATDRDHDFQVHVTAMTNRGGIDVTADTVFTSSNPGVVSVTKSGAIEVLQPGKYFVTARYLDRTLPITIIRSFTPTPPKAQFESRQPRTNFIDKLVEQSLSELGLDFPPPASDSVWLRRLYLDLTGRLPTPDEVQSYLDSTAAGKKMERVDQILRSAEFARYWTYWLRGVIRFRRPGNDIAAARELDRWLQAAVDSDRGWSDLTRELLLSTGDTAEIPAANFHRFFQDARGEAEVIASSFLGFRIGCANCHNHPLDHWTQEDYHGLAAMFATLNRGKTVSILADGFVIQPKTGKPAAARIPGSDQPLTGSDHRRQLVDWMIDSSLYRSAMANRVWKHLMGRGIVEPVDDFRSSNPPIDDRLLTALADEFARHQFRFRPLIRQIVTSDLYASRPAPAPAVDFSACYSVKPLAPAVYHDICRQVLHDGALDKIAASAVANFERMSADESLKLLQGCEPGGVCQDVSSESPSWGLREKLHLINGEFLNRWIDDPDNRIHDLSRADQKIIEVLEHFYELALSRRMTPVEQSFWRQQIAQQATRLESLKERTGFLKDAVWSLLTSREFRSVH